MSNHTPGPWRGKPPEHIAWKRPSGAFVIFGGPDGSTLICQRPWAEGSPAAIQEQEANYRLILAAPDLLEACQLALLAITQRTPGIRHKAAMALREALVLAKDGGRD